MAKKKPHSRIRDLDFDLWTLQYKILSGLKKGEYAGQIAKDLNISKTRISYWIRKFSREKLIEQLFRSSYQAWTLTKEGEAYFLAMRKKSFRSTKPSLPKRTFVLPVTRLHRLRVKFPILEDKQIKEWNRKVELKNWIKQYEVIPYPIGITVEKTSKSIIAHFHQFKTERPIFMSDFTAYVLKGTLYLTNFLKSQGITINVLEAEVIDQHIANKSPEYEDQVDDKLTASLSLNRQLKSIFPAKGQAEAWIDRSEGELEIETNDLEYEEKLLRMPENMDKLHREMVPVLAQFTHQLKLHLAVEREQLKTQKKMQETLEQIQEALK